MLWHKIRSGVMFVVSFITCPCHLPLTLPLALILLAGTPAAGWITQNVGWVYGGMIILFLVSLVLGFRWMGQTDVAACKPHSANSIKKISIQMGHEGAKHE